MLHSLLSHPTWVRGLKLIRSKLVESCQQSHPTWVRGLKHNAVASGYALGKVAPYVGAWIETTTCDV